MDDAALISCGVFNGLGLLNSFLGSPKLKGFVGPVVDYPRHGRNGDDGGDTGLGVLAGAHVVSLVTAGNLFDPVLGIDFTDDFFHIEFVGFISDPSRLLQVRARARVGQRWSDARVR